MIPIGINELQALAHVVNSGDVLLSSQLNQPEGVPQLNDDGNIVGTILIRTGLAAAIDLIVLENGELAWCEDTHVMRVGDGITPGGYVNSQSAATVYYGNDGANPPNPVSVITTVGTPLVVANMVQGARYRFSFVGYAVDPASVSNARFWLASNGAFSNPVNSQRSTAVHYTRFSLASPGGTAIETLLVPIGATQILASSLAFTPPVAFGTASGTMIFIAEGQFFNNTGTTLTVNCAQRTTDAGNPIAASSVLTLERIG